MKQIEHNPDVLNCLANLSNDEVFTPPALVNQMLDLLPQELFKDPNSTFLDPFCKTGVFLREIVKRLDKGLEDVIPDRQERIDHILHKQVFGMAITELTSLLTRRTLYCSKFANGEHSISHFDNPEGNIWYKSLKHDWDYPARKPNEKDEDYEKRIRCKYCGAPYEIYGRSTESEQYAYPFIHLTDLKSIYNMQFSVICGNPPYQINVGVEKENYAIAIYNKFVEQAIALNPQYLSVIIPARWYAGGRGLDDFRDLMLHDNRLRIIHDYPNAADCFPGVQIKAGVCYFLWDREHPSLCKVFTHLNNNTTEGEERPLLEKDCETFIRYSEAVSVLRKVQSFKEKSFSELVSPQTPFGIITSYKGTKEKHSSTDIMMYVSGNEKEFKGTITYAPIDMMTKGHEMVPWHKIYIGEAGSGSDSFPHSILSKPFYGEPGTICNQSYLVIGPFKDKSEAENVISYIKTKFFRFMVLQKKNAQHAMRGVYQFVPVQDFSHPWTDKMLYEKYGITEEEIAFIDSMIRPMD